MLQLKELPDNPFVLFNAWYEEALGTDMDEPTAMTLSTVDANGKPHSRVILLKDHSEKGFVFYTNNTSMKGKELHESSNVALCLYWMELGKQIRIEGTVEPVSDKEADIYFASRSRGSQIGAWASHQSKVMEHKDDLAKRVKEIVDEFEGDTVPRPPFWSGYRVKPESIEFWLKGEFRLHTRIKYTKEKNNKWTWSHLYP